tara:strand:- start:2263 stop:3228 length:966 start_codon:yes stop_codon:yes gene_type:complete
VAVYTKITLRDINLIEKYFNIGKINSFIGIKKGIENTNYLIKTKHKKYILTIFEKRVHSKDLPFFMKLMSGLAKNKIKCPKPIKNKKGNHLFKIKNKNACIVTFLKGKDKVNVSSKECFIIGKNIAKLHNASKKLKIYRKNSLSVNSWSPLLNKINKRINKLSKNLVQDIKIDLVKIKKIWPKNLPKGIIHGDLFIDNIFFFKKRFHGFIDFYFSSNDYYAYELAICINALCFNKKNKKFTLNQNKSSNLLRGYQSIRKLTNKEKKNFNILCIGSALRYLLTRAYDYLNTPKTALIKIKDPREYIQKLNFHKNLNSFKDYI